MKMLKSLFLAVLVLLIGGLGYVAFIDVSVPQSEITKTISHERIFNDQNS